MNSTYETVARIVAGLEAGTQLIGTLNEANDGNASREELVRHLESWKEYVDLLPSPLREDGMLTVHGCGITIDSGEFRAARRQLTWFLRRLRTKQKEWATDLEASGKTS